MANNLRSVINAAAYVIFAVCVAAGPVFPHLFPIVPFAYGIALLAQRGRPLLVVLRRFGSTSTDFVLTTKILVQVARYARVVWLEDVAQDHLLLKVRRHSLLAFVIHLACVAAVWQQLQLDTPATLLESFALTLLIGLGSLLIIEAGVGNPPYGALVFYSIALLVSRSSYGARFAEHLQIGQAALVGPLTLTVAIFLLLSLRHRLSPRMTISSERRLKSLERRPSALLGLKSRLQSTGPALVDRIEVRGVSWERVVLLFFKRASYAAIDITDLSIGSALEWEIRQAHARGIRVFYVCSQADVQSAISILRQILGRTNVYVFEYGDRDSHDEFLRLHASLLWFFRPDVARRRLKSG